MIARISRPVGQKKYCPHPIEDIEHLPLDLAHWAIPSKGRPVARASHQPPTTHRPPRLGARLRPANQRRATVLPPAHARAHAIRLAGPHGARRCRGCRPRPRGADPTVRVETHPARTIRPRGDGSWADFFFCFCFFWSAAPFRISPAACRCYGRAGDPHPLYASLFGLYAAAGRHPPPRRRQPAARFRPPPPPSPPPPSPSRRPSAGPPPPPPAAPSAAHRKGRISAAAAVAAGDVAAVAAARHGRVAACCGACRGGGRVRSSVYHPLRHYPLC